MQPGGKLQAYLGVVMLQPHACAQRFRSRILRRTRSFPGRTSVRSLPGGIESVWETPSKERDSKTCCPSETKLGPSMQSTLKGLVGGGRRGGVERHVGELLAQRGCSGLALPSHDAQAVCGLAVGGGGKVGADPGGQPGARVGPLGSSA